MNGFERLKEQAKDQEDAALQETVKYLLGRKDLEQAYLKEEKNLEEMCNFIREKGKKHSKNGWNFITNEIVYAWSVMYFLLPNNYLNIKSKTTKSEKTSTNALKNNVVSLEKAKQEIKKKKEITQLSLFGGIVDETR